MTEILIRRDEPGELVTDRGQVHRRQWLPQWV